MDKSEEDPLKFIKDVAEATEKHLSERYANDPHAYIAEILAPVVEHQKKVLKELGPEGWEELRRKVLADGGIKHATMIAHMPQHEPIRMMTGVSPGIYPILDPSMFSDGPKSRYYQYTKRGEKASDQSQTDSPSSAGDSGQTQDDPPKA